MIADGNLIGIGCDLAEIERIESSWQEWGDDFLKRVLTEQEKEIFFRKNKSMEFLAGRFAIKEATAKALGLGFRKQIKMGHFNCGEDENKKPLLTLDDFAITAYNNHCRKSSPVVKSIHAYASISHTRKLAQGFVILTAVHES